MVLNQFDPSKTLYFKGFSGIDSPAAMHSATATGFTVSGVFSKAAAFWDLVIFDSYDFFNHPRIKPLPDQNLAGKVLEYDVHFSGAVGYDCPKYPTIDWRYLDWIKDDGTSGRIDLGLGAGQTTIKSGTHGAASATATVNYSGTWGDVITLWWDNYAFSWAVLATDNAASIAAGLAAAVNAYTFAGETYKFHATSSGANVTLTASPAGVDANIIRLYWVSSNPAHVSITQPNPIQFAGGSSDLIYHVRIDFSALGLTSARQLWLTFAPLLADSADYTPTNADITFTNWGLTSGSGALQVAAPGSVRVEENSDWVTLKGGWTRTNAYWFSQGFAAVSANVGDSITVTYWCPHVHDVWIGTSLYSDRGRFTVTVDGAAVADLDMQMLGLSEAIGARRKVASGLSAGQHTVVLTINRAGPCYFDFLEAVVPGDVPAAPGPWLDRKPAADFDTQHGYQLPPARIFWMMDALGFSGSATPYYLYSGVFWLNQRHAVGRTLASLTIDFGTLPTLTPGAAQIFLDIGGSIIGKSVFAGESASIWAMHFALFVNQTFSGVRASYSGAVLTLYTRDDTAAYAVAVSSYYNNGAGNVAIAQSAPDLTGSTAGTWEVDPAATPALNYAAQQWHADFFAQAAARSTQVATALSMEVVYPPAGWAQQFADGSAVVTDTGFSGINSTQCAPMSPNFLAYEIALFTHLAALQSAAGLAPYLVLGEHLWWYFASTGGSMAYYDADTSAAALAALGRPLATFTAPTNVPTMPDAGFLASRLAAHVAAIIAAVPGVTWGLLLPMDVNGSTPTPVSNVGGQLNAAVNIPAAWTAQGTAPFSKLWIEALAFSTTDHNIDLMKVALAKVAAWAWPSAARTFLYSIDNASVQQWSDYRLGKRYGYPAMTPFAFDHVNLLGWRLDPPREGGAQIL